MAKKTDIPESGKTIEPEALTPQPEFQEAPPDDIDDPFADEEKRLAEMEASLKAYDSPSDDSPSPSDPYAEKIAALEARLAAMQSVPQGTQSAPTPKQQYQTYELPDPTQDLTGYLKVKAHNDKVERYYELETIREEVRQNQQSLSVKTQAAMAEREIYNARQAVMADPRFKNADPDVVDAKIIQTYQHQQRIPSSKDIERFAAESHRKNTERDIARQREYVKSLKERKISSVRPGSSESRGSAFTDWNTKKPPTNADEARARMRAYEKILRGGK
jgi:hypothetical protein